MTFNLSFQTATEDMALSEMFGKGSIKTNDIIKA